MVPFVVSPKIGTRGVCTPLPYPSLQRSCHPSTSHISRWAGRLLGDEEGSSFGCRTVFPAQPRPVSLPACLSHCPRTSGRRSFYTFLGSFTISSSSVLSLFSILKPLGSAAPSPPNIGSEHLKGTQRTCHLTLGTCYWATFSAPPLQNQTKTANRKRSSFKNYSIIIK